jgi:hypothetical protein
MKMSPVLPCLLALAACSGKAPPPTAKPAVVTTPFDGMRADEQRAKDVAKTLDKQAEKQRQQIEAQEQ